MLRSRALRQAMARPPIWLTSWATAMLDTVARPTWLSGMRKADATLLITPIWWRTCIRSGRVGGSISQITSNGRSSVTTRSTLPVQRQLRNRFGATPAADGDDDADGGARSEQ